MEKYVLDLLQFGIIGLSVLAGVAATIYQVLSLWRSQKTTIEARRKGRTTDNRVTGEVKICLGLGQDHPRVLFR